MLLIAPRFVFPQSDQEDRQRLAKDAARAALQGASRLRIARHMILSLLSKGFDYLKHALPMAIFFFKFLEWWYASEYHSRGDTKPIPPPPEDIPVRADVSALAGGCDFVCTYPDERVFSFLAQPNPAGLPVPSDPTVCPICLKPRTNPTTIPSGFVFCYPCIFNYVDEAARCPVTWVATRTDELRKIYSM